MNNIISNPIIMAVFIGAVLLIVALFYQLSRKNVQSSNSGGSDKFEELYKKISEDIKYAVSPKFVELSHEVNDLVDVAIEVWRMEQRIAKSASSLPENQLKGLENSTQKLRRYLGKYDIEIIDYKNTKYNAGLNLDILSVEKDSALPESIVKETVEPTIMYKGQVIRKAKIILLSNQ